MQLFYLVVRTYLQLLVVAGLVSHFSFSQFLRNAGIASFGPRAHRMQGSHHGVSLKIRVKRPRFTPHRTKPDLAERKLVMANLGNCADDQSAWATLMMAALTAAISAMLQSASLEKKLSARQGDCEPRT